MSTRQQTVRTYEPTAVERFDDQFWPILMSLCITSAVLAATIVTLMAGFWMWISLMVLPAAITVMLISLLFTDNRKLRRSFQLAVILSLAVHCVFIIYAKQTQVFGGFFLQVNRTTTPVQQQRIIHISRQVENQPWLDENPVPTPDVSEPVPEKQSVVETSTSRPQPSQVTSQNPTENPQLVRRQQLSRTVPRLGKNPSQLSRQTENQVPKSSEQVATARAAPRNRESKKAEVQPDTTELTRRSTSEAPRAEKSARPGERPRRTSESQTARSRSEERPSVRPAQPRVSRRETATPRAETATPRRNIQAPVAAAQPESPRTASMPSDTATLERRSTNSPNPTTARIQRERTAASTSNQLAQRQPESRRESPAVANRQPTVNRSRSTTTATTSASPEMVERPRPATTTRANSGVSEMNPQPMSLERSSGGVSGVGRTANYDRNVASRQSSAMAASDSMRRREETTQQTNPNSLSLRQMSRVPRSAASAEIPSVVNRPDSIAIASRPAASATAELTASASASLSQSDSDARRSESSVAKGSGSVDLGPTKIVSDTIAERVEGGGQPQIQPQPASPQATRRGDQGSSAPSLASETVERIATDRSGSTDSQISDTPTPEATADLIARSGGQAADSGAPIRSDNSSEDRANTSAVEMADASLGRANLDADSDDEDEEEERRRRQRAEQLARASRELSGSDTPTFDSEIEQATGGAAQRNTMGQASTMDEAAAELAERSFESGTGGGAERNMTAADSAGDGEAESEAFAERAESNQDSPGVAGNRVAQSQRATSGSTNLAEGDRPQSMGQVEAATGQANQITDDSSVAELDRSSPPGMALDIDAREGPAGISNQREQDPGIDSPRASRSSPAIQSMTETRFRRHETGGAPSVSAAPVIAKQAFRTRNQPSRSRSAPRTEEAIESGLAFLARQQQEDGSWTLHGIPQDHDANARRLSSDSAATGLAILAFQGAGYNHKEFKYAGQLQSAIKWLIDNQQDTGELYIKSDRASDNVCRFYSHGIATLALCEAYGMTQDEELRIPAQLALEFITETQHERLGGWRYRPGVESDTSVTGWMMMALQSGKLTELETDEKTWLGIKRWLRMARATDQDHLFRYNPEAVDKAETRHGRDVSPCMTAVGLLMHVYLGWDRLDPRLTEGADYLLQNMPDDSTITKRDTYYWYYATQIIRHVGGESWEKWHGALHPLLVGSQIQDGEMAGSWDPLNPVPDRWGAQAGRLYVTAMNLLSLEVDYRLLPLHDDTVR